MKAKHARLIRYGIQIARMEPAAAVGPLSSLALPRLTIRAYLREDRRVLKRMLHPNARCSQTVELNPGVDLSPLFAQSFPTDREQSTASGPDERTTE